MKLQINVTKEILEKSKNCKEVPTHNCAIAIAVRDVFPSAKIYNTYLTPLKSSECWKGISLPQEATMFIRDFDAAEPEERAAMNPITFEIDIPDEVIEKINIDEVKELLKEHPTMQLV
ncbi:MAG TPA: hypothetical protein VF622_04705 [Segetibacter sp.]|jgi:hypothetical protein